MTKACPFCESVALGIGRGTEDREGFPVYIYCADCGAKGPWAYSCDKAAFTNTDHCAELTGWNGRKKPEEK